MNNIELSDYEKELYKFANECALKGIDIEKTFGAVWDLTKEALESVVNLTNKNYDFLKKAETEVIAMIQTDKGHFWLTFKNGYTISAFNGFGSYSENHFKNKLLSVPDFASIDSKDCEIAIIYNGVFVTRNFIECNDDVKGYVSADELADIIYTVKNFKGDDNVKDRL